MWITFCQGVKSAYNHIVFAALRKGGIFDILFVLSMEKLWKKE